MPTYEFKCSSCGELREEFSTMGALNLLKQRMEHCDEQMNIVVGVGSGFFERSSFPKDYFEHADFEPRKFKDKQHLLDHCEEV